MHTNRAAAPASEGVAGELNGRSDGVAVVVSPGHAGLARSLGSRSRLNAALAKTKSRSTLPNPRSFTLRSKATHFNHPKAGSMRGRGMLTLRVAAVTSGTAVDGTATAPRVVLADVRRHVEGPQVLHTAVGVVPFVRAVGAATAGGPLVLVDGERQRGVALRRAICLRGHSVSNQPLPV